MPSRRPSNAAPIASIASRSRPSETFGIASRVVAHAYGEHVAAGVEHLLAVDLEARVEDDHIEMDRNRDGAADPGARAERDVDRAEDLFVLEHVARQPRPIVRADAELGQVGAELAVRAQPLDEASGRGRRRRATIAPRHGQPRRLVAETERRQARGDDRSLAVRAAR